MHEFIARHQEQIVGVLSGFDRVVFRGTLRPIAYADGLKRYLSAHHVLLKDFGRHVEEVSGRLKEAAVAAARAAGRPVKYLPSSQTDKEAIARRIVAADGLSEGLVCVLSCVEPCRSLRSVGIGTARSWRWKPATGSVCSSTSTGCTPCSGS